MFIIKSIICQVFTFVNNFLTINIKLHSLIIWKVKLLQNFNQISIHLPYFAYFVL